MGFPYYISLGIGGAIYVVSFDWSFEFLKGELVKVVSPGSMKCLVAPQSMIVVVLMIWLFTDIFTGIHKVLSLGKAVST